MYDILNTYSSRNQLHQLLIRQTDLDILNYGYFVVVIKIQFSGVIKMSYVSSSPQFFVKVNYGNRSEL